MHGGILGAVKRLFKVEREAQGKESSALLESPGFPVLVSFPGLEPERQLLKDEVLCTGSGVRVDQQAEGSVCGGTEV